MHPSRLRLRPSQSKPLTDASPGSAWSPGRRVCRTAPSRRRNIHTHALFRTERQSFLRCRDMRLTISRKQRSGHAAAPKAESGSKPVRRSKSTTVQDETGHSPRRIHRLWADSVRSTIAVPWQECANSGHCPGARRMGQSRPIKDVRVSPMTTTLSTRCRSLLDEDQMAPYNPANRLQNRNRRADRRIASEGARA